ncbi:hypothetical protein LSUE1_G008278 [Lachnellula suecica]|uniref:DNA-directed RNA polymerase I subunit n=1 Tax=Lachnellula suecica TaxID=602035 RepID=A0A8T9BTK0_9HELO|nr:hypothetical protein LSUE1_G008278 [Lachnellula suecica]
MPSLNAMNKAAKSKKAPAPKKAPEKKPSTYSALSSEFVHESDDEDDEDDNKESESEDDSLPENLAEALPKPNGKSAAADESSSSSEGSSESEEESEEDEEVSPKQASPPAKSAKKLSNEPAPQSSTAQAPPQYQPPAGFESSSIQGTPQAAAAFKKSSLKGKEIWYFTAPASMPISSLKEMSLSAMKKGEKVCSYDNNDYGFIQDTVEDKTYTKIMVPNSSDDVYRTISKPIDQMLHLQRIVQVPGTNTAEESSKATVPAKKPVRPQPKGLKMRFLPIGFGEGKPGKIGSDSNSVDGSSTGSASDEEIEEAPKTFKKPATLEESSSESSSDEEMTEAPPLPKPTKSKKSAETPSSTLKRKHSEGSEKKAKHTQAAKTAEDKAERLASRQSISVN